MPGVTISQNVHGILPASEPLGILLNLQVPGLYPGLSEARICVGLDLEMYFLRSYLDCTEGLRLSRNVTTNFDFSFFFIIRSLLKY